MENLIFLKNYNDTVFYFGELLATLAMKKHGISLYAKDSIIDHLDTITEHSGTQELIHLTACCSIQQKIEEKEDKEDSEEKKNLAKDIQELHQNIIDLNKFYHDHGDDKDQTICINYSKILKYVKKELKEAEIEYERLYKH